MTMTRGSGKSAVMLFVLAVLALASIARNKVWRDEITVWNDVVEKSPGRSRGYIGRGNSREKLGLLNEAAEDFNRAISLDPLNAEAYDNRGVFYERQNMLDAAIRDFSSAILLGK